MKDLETSNSIVLKYGVYIAIAAIAVGFVLGLAGISAGTAVMTVGIALLIIVPFLGIVVSVISLYSLRDSYWLKVALLLTAITVIGMVIAYF